jgi:hypothetical protein
MLLSLLLLLLQRLRPKLVSVAVFCSWLLLWLIADVDHKAADVVISSVHSFDHLAEGLLKRPGCNWSLRSSAQHGRNH